MQYSGRFIDYLMDRDDVRPAWHGYTHHEFTQKMGDGTLPPETFKYYMIQDYLYLIHFARANALAGYKAKTLDDIAAVSTRSSRDQWSVLTFDRQRK